MSEIDKSLPNVKQEIELPSEEEVVEASQENIKEAKEWFGLIIRF